MKRKPVTFERRLETRAEAIIKAILDRPGEHIDAHDVHLLARNARHADRLQRAARASCSS